MTKKTTKSKEEQQGRILAYEHFDLCSVKVNSEGVDMAYYNLLFPNAKEEPKTKVIAHPDLQAALDKLKLYFATKIGILEGWDFAREHCRDNQDALKMAMDKHKEIVESCKITGLTFAGEGETYGVTIAGYLKFPKKGGSGVSSGKIVFSKKTFGWEDEVKELCEDVKAEVYAYRFQAKKYQTDIETEADKAENPDLFEKPEAATKEDLK